MFEGIKKSLELIEYRYNIFNNLKKFKVLKIIIIKINTLKILNQISYSKDNTLYYVKNGHMHC